MELYSRRSIGEYSKNMGYLICVPTKYSNEGNILGLEVLLELQGFVGNNILSSNAAERFKQENVETIPYFRLDNESPLPLCDDILRNLSVRGGDGRCYLKRRLLFYSGKTKYLCELNKDKPVQTPIKPIIMKEESNFEKLRERIKAYLKERRTKIEVCNGTKGTRRIELNAGNIEAGLYL